MGEAWIIDAVRTPRGKGKKDTGALSGIHPAGAARAVPERAPGAQRLRPEATSRTWSRAASREVNEQGACIARNAVLARGLARGPRPA